MTNVVVIYIHI